MTRTLVSVSWRLIPAAALAVAGAAGCGGRASAICSADPSPSADAVLIDVSLDANAGGTPFGMGKQLTSNGGVEYSVSTLRFYLSHVELLDSNGVATPAVLADANGTPLHYGVTLVDYRKPDSQLLHLLVPPGSYESLSLSVGVPKDCSGGSGVLNHENASEQSPPLDVDSDMYWGWDPGYVFFKIEGHAITPAGSKAFLFHLGDDKRYATANVPARLDVSGPAAHRLAMDINRLFTTAAGEEAPDMTGATTSSIAHGGKEADTIVNNLKSSGVLQWND
jgi:hypothetical protein